MAAPPYMPRRPMAAPPPPKDLSDPGGFGKKPAAAPPPPDDDSDDPAMGGPDMGGGGGVVLTLEQMGYHDEPHACALCKHYGQDGTCEVAQQQVNPDGGCQVFAGQDEGQGMPPAPMGAGMPMGGQAPPPPQGMPS